MHCDCRRGKRRDNTKISEQKSPIVFIFLISGMLTVISIRGVILNPPLTGNSKIYEADLTFLIGIHARCQPSVCTIILKCFPIIFWYMLKAARVFWEDQLLLLGLIAEDLYMTKGATRGYGKGLSESQRYIIYRVKRLWRFRVNSMENAHTVFWWIRHWEYFLRNEVHIFIKKEEREREHTWVREKGYEIQVHQWINILWYKCCLRN